MDQFKVFNDTLIHSLLAYFNGELLKSLFLWYVSALHIKKQNKKKIDPPILICISHFESANAAK
jgi:hypothetical protein